MLKRQAKQSLYQAVADEIKRHIITQGLGPGDPLPTERELCEQMGVSRSSVREAIRILEYLGVVTVKPKEGITVSTPRLKPFLDHLQYMSEIGEYSFQDLWELRRYYEQICLELACRRATEQDFGAMEEAIATMEKAITEGKSPAESDFRFHKVLARSTGNPLLASLVELFGKFFMEEFLMSSFLHLDNTTAFDTVNEHRKILEALRRKDLQRANGVLEEHLSRIKHKYLAWTTLQQVGLQYVKQEGG